MAGLVIFILSSADHEENRVNASRWASWVGSFVRGGKLTYHATVNRGVDPIGVAFTLEANTTGAGEDTEIDEICVVAHGGDSAHFLDDLGRVAALRVAGLVRDFIAGKTLAHEVKMRVQVCNAGRYPDGDTFQNALTPTTLSSIAPRRTSVLWNNGRYIDLCLTGSPGTLIGEARDLIREGGSLTDFTILKKFVPLASVAVLMSYDEDNGKWKLKAGNAPATCNSEALRDNAFTKPQLRAFLIRLAKAYNGGAGRKVYDVDDAKAFKAIPQAGRYSLVQFATGGDTQTCPVRA